MLQSRGRFGTATRNEARDACVSLWRTFAHCSDGPGLTTSSDAPAVTINPAHFRPRFSSRGDTTVSEVVAHELPATFLQDLADEIAARN